MRPGASSAVRGTLYTIYYIDGAVAGSHLTPRLVGFLDPLDREFFETFTTVPGVGFMCTLKCLVRPMNEIAGAIERGDEAWLKELPFVGAKTAQRMVLNCAVRWLNLLSPRAWSRARWKRNPMLS
jgi:Holliday junction resolvasome RuvABC DNA-binding subunit